MHSYYGDRMLGLYILKAEEFIWDNGFQEYNSPCQMYSFPVELAPPHTHIHTAPGLGGTGSRSGPWKRTVSDLKTQPNLPK